MLNLFAYEAYPDEEVWSLSDAEGKKLFCYKRYTNQSYFGRRCKILEAEYFSLRLMQTLLQGSSLFEVCSQVALLTFDDDSTDRPRGQVLKVSHTEGTWCVELDLETQKANALAIVSLGLVNMLLLGDALGEFNGVKLLASGKLSIGAMQPITKASGYGSMRAVKHAAEIQSLLDTLVDNEADRIGLFKNAVCALFRIVANAATRLNDVDMEDNPAGLALKSMLEANVAYVKDLCLDYLSAAELVEMFLIGSDFDSLPVAAPAA